MSSYQYKKTTVPPVGKIKLKPIFDKKTDTNMAPGPVTPTPPPDPIGGQ